MRVSSEDIRRKKTFNTLNLNLKKIYSSKQLFFTPKNDFFKFKNFTFFITILHYNGNVKTKFRLSFTLAKKNFSKNLFWKLHSNVRKVSRGGVKRERDAVEWTARRRGEKEKGLKLARWLLREHCLRVVCRRPGLKQVNNENNQEKSIILLVSDGQLDKKLIITWTIKIVAKKTVRNVMWGTTPKAAAILKRVMHHGRQSDKPSNRTTPHDFQWTFFSTKQKETKKKFSFTSIIQVFFKRTFSPSFQK